MRIVLASEFYAPSVGGVQEVMRQIGERLVEAGHEVTVITTYLPERKTRLERGVQIVEFNLAGNLVNGIRGDVDGYRRFVLEQDYDVLMIKAAQQWTFDALVPVLHEIRKPKVFIPCGFSGLFDPAYAEYFRDMPDWLRQFERLIFYASQYRDIDLARRHGLSNIHVLPNGADEREFNAAKDRSFRSRHGIPEDAFVVMTVGSVTGLKGHLELAAAFEKCDFGSSPACLLLIGNSPRALGGWQERVKAMYRVGGVTRLAKWALRPLFESLGLQWLLRALGYPERTLSPDAAVKKVLQRVNAIEGRKALLIDLPRPEVIQAYLNSNLFVFASKIEYSPLVLFEAAAAALPFLSVPVGNAAEIAAWTGGGVICEAEVDANGYTQVDPAKLAHEIDSLKRQPEILARLASDGRQAWEQRFSWSTIFRSYEKIFEQCLEQVTE